MLILPGGSTLLCECQQKRKTYTGNKDIKLWIYGLHLFIQFCASSFARGKALNTSFSCKFTIECIVKMQLRGICYISTDECKQCHVNATCKNAKEPYMCSCKEGFTGDGMACQGQNIK